MLFRFVFKGCYQATDVLLYGLLTASLDLTVNRIHIRQLAVPALLEHREQEALVRRGLEELERQLVGL